MRVRTSWAAVCALGCQEVPADVEVLPRGEEPVVAAPETQLTRLTDAQYRNIIRDVFGSSVALPTNLDPVDEVGGLESVGASLSSISALGVERFEAAAYQVAEQVLHDSQLRNSLLYCNPRLQGMLACQEEAFTRLGRILWRRPLQEDEIRRILSVAVQAEETLDDEDAGWEFGLAMLMMAPQFLYREELGVQGKLSGHELASKLSFFLWNTLPDERLRSLADDGRILQPEHLEEEVSRMLEDERVIQGVEAFFGDLLDLDLLEDMSKDPLVYKHMSADLPESAREETLTVLSDLVVHQDGDYREFFTTQRTWVDRRLAAIYGIEAPNMDGFGWAELPTESGRRGFLGQVGFLALNAHAVSSSVTLRGIFVREKILCHTIPGPPADVNTSIPEASEELPTMRERVARHLEDPACASCHEMTDLIGLGLENFDGIARWRTRENGQTIDSTGSLDGVAFGNAWKLGQVLGQHPDLGPCLTQNLFAHANHRSPVFEERDILEWHGAGLEESGFRVLSLMRDIATSSHFSSGSIKLEEGTDG